MTVASEIVCPGVWRVAGPGITDDRDCCAYLVEGGGELALIDAGLGPSAPLILENILALGFKPQQVRYLVATRGHIDHTGGLARLKTATGARWRRTVRSWRPSGTGSRIWGQPRGIVIRLKEK